MADANAKFLAPMVRYFGLWRRTNGTCPQAMNKTGEPDTLAYTAEFAINIECKCSNKSDLLVWDASKWTPEQRNWAKHSALAPHFIPWFMFLTLGERAGTKTDPKRSWLIPYHYWVFCIEEALEPIQKTLRYKTPTRKSPLDEPFYGTLLEPYMDEVRPLNVHFPQRDAVTMFAPYELEWHGANTLDIPVFFRPEEREVKKYSYGFWLPKPEHPFRKIVGAYYERLLNRGSK